MCVLGGGLQVCVCACSVNMYHVSAQGVDELMIIVRYYYSVYATFMKAVVCVCVDVTCITAVVCVDATFMKE